MIKQNIFLTALLMLISNIAAQNLPRKGICAHRGVSFTHPENTLASIKEAIKHNMPMIEFDVRLTKDKGLVLMHDNTVDRTTNGSGAVKDLTLSEIKRLDAGVWKGEEFKGVKVPTFEEVLDIVPDSTLMNIHVKKEFETAKLVAKVLTERNQIRNAVMAVENKSAIAVRKINPKINICCMERGETPEEYVENAIAINADFIQLREREYPVINKVIEKLKKHHIAVNFYHAEDYEMLKSLFDAGVDFVLVNNAGQLLKEAKQTGLLK